MPSEETSCGILALQGGYAAHGKALDTLGCPHHFVRTRDELEKSCALILPGGESTSHLFQLKESELLEPLRHALKTKPCFGTCAGLILLKHLGALDIELHRNGYGRQKASFEGRLSTGEVGIFIRAPRILDAKECRTLATYNNEPVAVQQGQILGLTFHPELGTSLTWYRYFYQNTAKNLFL